MKTFVRLRWLAPLLALALVAAACGSTKNDSTNAGGNILDKNASDAAQQAVGGSSTTSGGGAAVATPKTMEEWEALWTKQRAAIVKQITNNG